MNSKRTYYDCIGKKFLITGYDIELIYINRADLLE